MKVDPRMEKLIALPTPDQIGMVSRDIEKTIGAYTKLFQCGPFEIVEREYSALTSTYRGKPGGFRYRVGYAQFGVVQLEIIQPLEGKTIYDEFLETRGDGLHHFGLMIQGIEEKVEALGRMGFQVLQSGQRPGRKYAYMDTEPVLGTIIEFREATATK